MFVSSASDVIDCYAAIGQRQKSAREITYLHTSNQSHVVMMLDLRSSILVFPDN